MVYNARMALSSRGNSIEIRVLCVDDHADIRNVLRMVIDAQDDMTCVGCLSSANTLVDEARRLHADIVLLDVSMPGKDPFEAILELTAGTPEIRTVVFSGWDDIDKIERATNAGASGWVSKDADPDTIIQATREVAAGETFFSSHH
jgi:DNA-binding NarL/FixJ family response regulator